MKRRTFIKLAASSAVISAVPAFSQPSQSRQEVPPHLKAYSDLYALDPLAASRAWFREAKFGLFMHYGVYSLLGRGEWVQYHEQIPVKEYETLKDRFTAENFDADFITDMALAAGMNYVNITARHHDSFCLFKTNETDFNSLTAPAGRDLIAELAQACHKKGLGLFLYYSIAADWRHPYFYPREAGWRAARPAYETPEPSYLWQSDKDFQIYLRFAHNQLRELLTQYGPLAGIWFDPIMGYYARPDLFPMLETYALVRSLQPHCLVSFKQGATGTEDFSTPERKMVSKVEDVRKNFGEAQARVAAHAWEKNRIKQLEICDTLLPRSWGYHAEQQAKHATPDEVLKKLEHAHHYRANLLLNTGPKGDGSIPEQDYDTLSRVGELRKA